MWEDTFGHRASDKIVGDRNGMRCRLFETAPDCGATNPYRRERRAYPDVRAGFHVN
jgi:hypothetical protein